MRFPLIGPFSREDNFTLDENRIISKILKQENGVMIDVGAHIGQSLMPFLQRDWTIYAFEPDDRNRQTLLSRVGSHSKSGNLHLFDVCLGEQEKFSVEFFESPISSGISGLHPFHPSHLKSKVVDVITLDQFIANHQLERVNYLKVDTEGHDLFVLKGFPWGKLHPDVILCEFESRRTTGLGYSAEELAQFLIAKDYFLYASIWHPVIEYGTQHQWERLTPYPCSIPELSWGNFIAIGNNNLKSSFIETMKAWPIV
jgi:FkbM family methyltransferase